MPVFRHDRPVSSLEDDLLWRMIQTIREDEEDRQQKDSEGHDPKEEEGNIREEIEEIAAAIAEPLDGLPRESLTFAVFGRWGSGKSSAMQMIRTRADEIAAGAKSGRGRLLHCEYNAAVNEHFAASYGHDVRTTLGMAILKAIAENDREKITRLLFKYAGPLVDASLQEAGANVSPTLAVHDLLQAIAKRLSHLIDYDVIISEILADASATPSVLAVYIDDLDRCAADFVWQVMNTIQQWSSIPNLYFVVAMDRHHLRVAMQERPGVSSDVDFALEKYIQHSVTVPEMNRGRMQAYLRSLAVPDDSGQAVLDVLSDNSRLLYHGLRVQTARSVKRFANTVSVVLKKHLDQDPPPTRRDTRFFVKKLILRYSWPQFYEEYYLVARDEMTKAKRGDHFASFQALEELCATYAGNPDEPRLRFELSRLQQRMGIDWSELDLGLASYLGQRPFLFPAPAGDELADNLAARRTAPEDPRMDNVDPEREDMLPTEIKRPDKVIWTLRQMYFEIRAAGDEDNRERAVELANEAYKLVRENEESFQEAAQGTASLVGDIASSLARIEAFAEAVRLFQLSLDFDAEPRVLANNIHRFVAVIVTQELTALYDDAKVLLERLNQPPYDVHRPEYTNALEAGLMIAQKDVGAGKASMDADALDAKIEEFAREPSDEWAMVGLAGAAQASGDYDTMARVVRARYEYESNPDGAYRALRLLADGLVSSDTNADVEIGVEIFFFLMDHVTCVSPEALEHDHALFFNCANSLYRLDYDDFAGHLYFEAYRKMPSEPLIQRAYGSYLARAKRPDLAARVHRGEPLQDDEIVLASATKELPDNFLPDGYDDWWTRKELFHKDCDAVRTRMMN